MNDSCRHGQRSLASCCQPGAAAAAAAAAKLDYLLAAALTVTHHKCQESRGQVYLIDQPVKEYKNNGIWAATSCP
jgi:hypothetical protein